MKNYKTIHTKVAELLIEHPAYRDSDQMLVAAYWEQECLKFGSTRILTANQFLNLYSAGKLTSSDTITRARRQVQEERVLLRGLHYKERRTKKVSEAIASVKEASYLNKIPS